MENLNSYLDGMGRGSASALAEACGVDPSTIHRLRRGKLTPGLALALKLERATDGAVPVRCWQVQEAAG